MESFIIWMLILACLANTVHLALLAYMFRSMLAEMTCEQYHYVPFDDEDETRI